MGPQLGQPGSHEIMLIGTMQARWLVWCKHVECWLGGCKLIGMIQDRWLGQCKMIGMMQAACVNRLVPASVQSAGRLSLRDISPIFSFKRYSALSTSSQTEWFCIYIIIITVYLCIIINLYYSILMYQQHYSILKLSFCLIPKRNS